MRDGAGSNRGGRERITGRTDRSSAARRGRSALPRSALNDHRRVRTARPIDVDRQGGGTQPSCSRTCARAGHVIGANLMQRKPLIGLNVCPARGSQRSITT